MQYLIIRFVFRASLTQILGMLLHWGKDFLMKLLPPDLQARFHETLVDPAYDGVAGVPIPHVNGETGRVMAEVAMPGLVRVSRKKLRAYLTSKGDLNISVRPVIEMYRKMLTNGARKFKKRLVSVDSKNGIVIATFDDGSFEQGTLIVGCDGSRSKVREYLVGAEATKPSDTGMMIINHAASGFTAEQARLVRKYHPVATCFYDPEISGIFLLTGRKAHEFPGLAASSNVCSP
jgi:hypothetical protein